MHLLINSSHPDSAFVALASKDHGVIVIEQLSSKEGVRPMILSEVDSMLGKNHLTPKDIEGVIVVTGPGHFSFLRTGVVIANTFGYVLGIPVVGVAGADITAENLWREGGVKISEVKEFVPVAPEYGREPNISIAKAK